MELTNDMIPYVLLWRAVLRQMLQDVGSKSSNPEEIEAREEAIHWLYNCPRNLQMVCDYAMVDYGRVQRVLKRWNGKTEGILRKNEPAKKGQLDFLETFEFGEQVRKVKNDRKRTDDFNGAGWGGSVRHGPSFRLPEKPSRKMVENSNL